MRIDNQWAGQVSLENGAEVAKQIEVILSDGPYVWVGINSLHGELPTPEIRVNQRFTKAYAHEGDYGGIGISDSFGAYTIFNGAYVEFEPKRVKIVQSDSLKTLIWQFVRQ